MKRRVCVSVVAVRLLRYCPQHQHRKASTPPLHPLSFLTTRPWNPPSPRPHPTLAPNRIHPGIQASRHPDLPPANGGNPPPAAKPSTTAGGNSGPSHMRDPLVSERLGNSGSGQMRPGRVGSGRVGAAQGIAIALPLRSHCITTALRSAGGIYAYIYTYICVCTGIESASSAPKCRDRAACSRCAIGGREKRDSGD